METVFIGGPWDGQRKKVDGSPIQLFTDNSAGPMHRYRSVQLPGGRVTVFVSDDIADNQLLNVLTEGYRGLATQRH